MIRSVAPLLAALALLSVPAAARAAVFSDAQPLSGTAPFARDSPPAAWSRYPATIAAQGLTGTIASVRVRFENWNQGNTEYVDALIEAPDGRRVMLTSDAGGSNTATQTNAADNVDVIFEQEAARQVARLEPFGPKNSTVEVRPVNYEGAKEDFPELPAAADTAPADLNTLVGGQPNGTWKLFVTMSHSGGGQATGTMAGWSIDVTTKPGVPQSPAQTAPGSGPVTGTQPPPAPIPGDVLRPSVSRAAVDNGSFRAATSGGPVGRAGAIIGFRLSEAASVEFDLERLTTGRRVNGRCIRRTRQNRDRPRCTRAAAVPGSFTFVGKAGDNTFRFTGRLNGRALSAGRYRLTGVAVDGIGNRSSPFSVTFSVLRRARRS